MAVKTFNSLGIDTAKGFRNSAKKALVQGSNQAKSNADLQSFLITNCTRVPVPDSRTSNPAKVNENEKHDLADQQRSALKDHLDSASGWLKTLLATSIARFSVTDPAGWLPVPLASGMAAITAAAKMGDLGTLILKLGMHRSHGWEMKRLTDGWMMFCKFMKVTAETAVHFRAPSFMVSADTVHVAATHTLTVTDLATSIVQDEIHTVANAFGLDAKYLTALLQATATIHANGKVDLASKTDMDIYGGSSLNLSSAGKLTMRDGTSGSISMSNGVINLNPLVPDPFPPTVTPLLLPLWVATDLIPPVTLDPANLPASTKSMPQYEGQGAHGALVV